MTEREYEVAKAEAEAIGREHGRNAASWYEVDEEATDRFLQGIEDGDPEILDTLPTADLSGEWADGYTTRQLLADLGLDEDAEGVQDAESDLADAYADAFNAEAERAVVNRIAGRREVSA